MKEIIKKVLEQTDDNGDTVKNIIAKSIAEKASAGDMNAIKFLKDMMETGESDQIPEIKVTIVD